MTFGGIYGYMQETVVYCFLFLLYIFLWSCLWSFSVMCWAQTEGWILRAEISCPKSCYVQKVIRMEHPEEAMDQLTEELQAALDNLKSQTGKIHQCEEEIERLREKMDSHQKWFVVKLASVLLRIKLHNKIVFLFSG